MRKPCCVPLGSPAPGQPGAARGPAVVRKDKVNKRWDFWVQAPPTAPVPGDSQSCAWTSWSACGPDLPCWFAWQPWTVSGAVGSVAPHPHCALRELAPAAAASLCVVYRCTRAPLLWFGCRDSHHPPAGCQQAGAAWGLLACVWFGITQAACAGPAGRNKVLLRYKRRGPAPTRGWKKWHESVWFHCVAHNHTAEPWVRTKGTCSWPALTVLFIPRSSGNRHSASYPFSVLATSRTGFEAERGAGAFSRLTPQRVFLPLTKAEGAGAWRGRIVFVTGRRDSFSSLQHHFYFMHSPVAAC